MPISYGPLTWATSLEDLEQDSSIIYYGKLAVGVDKYGIPIDENHRQLLPMECIVHPDARVATRHKTFVVNGTALNVEYPAIECCEKWFKDNFIEISYRTLLRYATLWVVRNNPRAEMNILLQHYNAKTLQENLYG